jgi:hypothetical protein
VTCATSSECESFTIDLNQWLLRAPDIHGLCRF